MKNIKGQSLFEVVIALGIAALIVTAVVALSTTSVRNSSFSSNKTLANRHAQGGMEWIRNQRDESWGTFIQNVSTSSSVGYKWCLNNLSAPIYNTLSCSGKITGTSLNREAFFENCLVSGSSVLCNDLSVNSVLVSVVVDWTDTQGFHTTKVSSIFTEWR